jgi:UDP-2-acetamido-3-amino-2,3-dideoxy-glucuronate N-acetyltransferase
VIGNGVKIQNNVSNYDAVTIEDGVFCGPSMVFTNVFNPRSEIIRKDEYRPTLIRRGATLGANSTIVCGHTVGRYAFVAAGAVVAGDVPDFALMAGVPARQRGGMCRCAGAKLQFDAAGTAACSACGAAYKLVKGAVVEEPNDKTAGS